MRKISHSNFELDLTRFKITDNLENPIFSDKYTSKYSFPIELDLEDDMDIALGFISFYNSSDPLTYIPVTYFEEDLVSDAVMEIEEIQGTKISFTLNYGFEEFPSWNKKLSELPLDKFEVPNIYTHAASIIPQTYPDVNYNFPQIHTDKIDNTDDIWFAFEKIINNYKDGAFLINDVDLVEDITYNRNIMQPLPYLLHVIKKGFESEGWSVSGNIFENDLIKKILVYADITYFTTFEQESHYISKMSEDGITEVREIQGTFTSPPVFSWQQPTTVTNPNQSVSKYTHVQVIDNPGKYRIIGKIDLYSMRFLPAIIKIKYRDTVIYQYSFPPTSSNSISSFPIRIVRNIDVVFETLSDLQPNEITIESEQFPTTDKIIFDININPIRLHNMAGDAIPTVLNPNQVDLTRAVPDMTFGELMTTVKNWFNIDMNFQTNNVDINFLQDVVNTSATKDFSMFEVKQPNRKFQKGNKFVLKFQDINSEDYKYDHVFHSSNEISTAAYTVDEKTSEIVVNGLPLPLLLRNGVQTAHSFEQNNSKLYFVLYDGLNSSGLNLTKDPTPLLIPQIHLSFYEEWFKRRLNSQLFTWSFKADYVELYGLKIRDKIAAYLNIHLLKRITRTEYKPGEFEIEVESEASI